MQAQATLLMPGIDRITGLSFSMMALICLPDAPKGNTNKLEIEKSSNQNINETLKKLRERVGN
jgi:hypothetical protein